MPIVSLGPRNQHATSAASRAQRRQHATSSASLAQPPQPRATPPAARKAARLGRRRLATADPATAD
jgi:hypothetical protein